MKGKDCKVKEEKYDYCTDFKILTKGEKRIILKTAKTLLKQQNDILALADAMPSKNEKQGVCSV